MKKIAVILFLTMFSMLFSQDISKEKTMGILSTLASDKMKGREIGTPENDSAAIFIAKKFKENGLDFCTGNSFLVPFKYRGKTVYNVCGIKKGKSEKSLAFSAHFDHIGFHNSSGDNIFNGADDNASGTTAVITLSEYFKDKATDFSMVFIAFNGEEHGMKGSQAIANEPSLEKFNKNIQALFNFEMIATESQFGKNALFMTGDDLSDLDELMNKNAANNLKIYPDPYKSQQLFYRSDNVSYVKKKVIAHSFSTVDMTKATHYHQVNDDLSVVDFDNLTQIINNFAKTVENLNITNFSPKYSEKVRYR